MSSPIRFIREGVGRTVVMLSASEQLDIVTLRDAINEVLTHPLDDATPQQQLAAVTDEYVRRMEAAHG